MIDVGANVRVYSLFMAKLVGRQGLVIACEPDATMQPHCARTWRNRFTQVEVAEVAVGDHEGSVGPWLGGERRAASRAGPDAGVTARLTTVGALCGDRAPICQGRRRRVRRRRGSGARQLSARGLPKVWQLEVDRGRSRRRAWPRLAEFGYRSFAWSRTHGRCSHATRVACMGTICSPSPTSL
jgi:hypothetical protein